MSVLLGRVVVFALLFSGPVFAQLAVRGERVHTMTGAALVDGVVLIEEGRITRVGPADEVSVPADWRVLRAAVVMPGLIDAHATVGLTGIFNQKQNQDQLERSTPIQPELRAIDAYNALDPLVGWVRQFGVTTVHTGHAPGELVSGQTMIVKTYGTTVEQALIRPAAMVAATLASSARKGGEKSPGTRGKMMALLRTALLEAEAYAIERGKADDDKPVERDLRKEALVKVLEGEWPLLVTAQRAQDIASALRLAREFELRLVLDGAAEAYLLLDDIREAGVPVIVHPTMMRASGEAENVSFETAQRLHAAGVPFAFQSGYESYVPKTRVVLFEAAIAASHRLGAEQALRALTIDAARLLRIDDRVGSIAIGKDGDLALYDGDPLEYTTHCTAVIIDGRVVSEGAY